MHHADTGLEVLVGWHILVMGGWCDVVREGQTVVVVLEVCVQQTLVGTVEGYTSLSHGHEGVVVSHVWGNCHHTRVEQVGPANIRCRCKRVWQLKQLIGSTQSEDIGVEIHNLAKLGKLPKIDLGESRMQIGTIHQLKVGMMLVLNAMNGDTIMVNRLCSGSARAPLPKLKGLIGSFRGQPVKMVVAYLELLNGSL